MASQRISSTRGVKASTEGFQSNWGLSSTPGGTAHVPELEPDGATEVALPANDDVQTASSHVDTHEGQAGISASRGSVQSLTELSEPQYPALRPVVDHRLPLSSPSSPITRNSLPSRATRHNVRLDRRVPAISYNRGAVSNNKGAASEKNPPLVDQLLPSGTSAVPVRTGQYSTAQPGIASAPIQHISLLPAAGTRIRYGPVDPAAAALRAGRTPLPTSRPARFNTNLPRPVRSINVRRRTRAELVRAGEGGSIYDSIGYTMPPRGVGSEEGRDDEEGKDD